MLHILDKPIFFSQLEYLRYRLYIALSKGNSDEILKASQDLDKLILSYMQKNSTKQKEITV